MDQAFLGYKALDKSSTQMYVNYNALSNLNYVIMFFLKPDWTFMDYISCVFTKTENLLYR